LLIIAPRAELEMAERGALEEGASKGVLTMVAQIRAEVFHHMPCTPERDPFDSEGVQLAVETARGLEGEGNFAGAAQWLRRAVREAEQQGNVLRAADLACAAEALAEKADPWEERALPATSASVSNDIDDDWTPAASPAPRTERSGIVPAPAALPASIPPLLAALISSMPPFSARASAEIPPSPATPSQHVPLCASPPLAGPSEPWSHDPTDLWPDAASTSASNDDIFTRTAAQTTSSVAKPADATEASLPAAPASPTTPERPLRVSAFRAAIPISDQRTNSFFIQRLANGQSAPAGMVVAMIVVTGESDGIIGFEASLDVPKRTR
jgi:hypothetical protein